MMISIWGENRRIVFCFMSSFSHPKFYGGTNTESVPEVKAVAASCPGGKSAMLSGESVNTEIVLSVVLSPVCL